MLLNVDNNGNTILHQAANLGTSPKVVLGHLNQMTWYVCWFKRIWFDSPPHFLYLENSNGITAKELFEENHKLRDKAEEAFKHMNNSLMLVTTLIGTINYTALFTLPGGYDQENTSKTYGQLVLLIQKDTHDDIEKFLCPGVRDTKIWCIEKERQALLILKQGLADDYGRLSSWRSEAKKADCCRWRGVHYSSQTGHVTMLDLGDLPITEASAIPLRGNISSSLVELQHLNYLDLSNNNFGGSCILEFIGSLSNLRHSLDLSPYGGMNVQNLEWLSHLLSLRHLNVQNVDLSNAKEWFQSVNKLPLLTSLCLGFCRLPKIVVPSYLNFSTSLAILDLSGNNLTSSIFGWLFNFSSAIEVDLSNNCLQGTILYAFGKMISLAHLDLSVNNVLEDGIPKSFSNLSKFQSLDLSFNNLNDSFSTVIQFLFGIVENSLLEFLKLSWNQLSGLLPNNMSFPRLTHLYLKRNLLDGSFPETFGQPLCNPLVLDLSQNQIMGSFPDLTRCSSLKELNLWKNQFKGTLSTNIRQLPNLEVLDVNSNHLEGLVSEAHLSNLSRLQFLDLSLNSLALEFSSKWIPPFYLDTIRLRSCKLGPYFPKWLQIQNNFSMLDISVAGISDTIPSWFWDLSPRTRLLNISHNQINGIVPDLSVKFPAFLAIDLSSN
ncbi:hypothetical protein ACSBR1_034958 [Camellia fascicularis]